MQLQRIPQFNHSPLKTPVNFKMNSDYDNEYIGVDTINQKTAEEIKAEKLKELAEKMKLARSDNSGKTSGVFKEVSLIGVITFASFLTGSAVSGRIFNFFKNKNVFKPMQRYTIKIVESFGTYVEKKQTLVKNEKLKTVLEATKKGINFAKKEAEKGFEKEISRIERKILKTKNQIEKAFKSKPENKSLSAEELKLALEQRFSESESIKNSFKEINQIKGENLTRKIVKGTSGGVMGVSAMTGAAGDKDNDNKADVAERRSAQKDATRQITAAILDVALDSCA